MTCALLKPITRAQVSTFRQQRTRADLPLLFLWFSSYPTDVLSFQRPRGSVLSLLSYSHLPGKLTSNAVSRLTKLKLLPPAQTTCPALVLDGLGSLCRGATISAFSWPHRREGRATPPKTPSCYNSGWKLKLTSKNCLEWSVFS